MASRNLTVNVNVADLPQVKAMFEKAKEEVDRLRAAVDAALAICDRHEHGATRWAEPLDIPEWIAEIRAALAPVADPDPHTTSDEETT